MHQPFGQAPWLTDAGISIFESGAILFRVAERSAALMPTDPRGRNDVGKWLFAALNSVEAASLPWSILRFSGDTGKTVGRRALDRFLDPVADILMADVLRLVDRFDGLTPLPACRAYVARATARPAFSKAHADQKAHFAAAD